MFEHRFGEEPLTAGMGDPPGYQPPRRMSRRWRLAKRASDRMFGVVFQRGSQGQATE